MTKQWFNLYSHSLYLIVDQTFTFSVFIKFTLVVFINDHHIIAKLFFSMLCVFVCLFLMTE